jgi:hypothetical protein
MSEQQTQNAGQTLPGPSGSALSMTFRIEGAGKTVEGTVIMPDDDGTTHLPMMIHGMLTQVVQSVPELCCAKSMTITAALNTPNDKDHR